MTTRPGESTLVSFEPLLRRRRTVVLLFLAVAGACLPGVARLRVDNAPEGFLVRDERALEELQRLELDFGRDRTVRLVLEGDGLWSREGLERLAALEQAAGDPRRAGGGVYGAAGPYLHHRWHRDAWPPEDPAAFRELARTDPVNLGAGWVSRDGELVTVLVGLHRMPRERREDTLARLEALLPPRPPGEEAAAGLSGHATGLPVVTRALDRALERMIVRTFPVLVAAAVLLLLVVLRSARAAALPLALVAVTETVVLGAMGYAGQRLDVVVIILVPLVFVIALATGLHVLTYHLSSSAGAGAPERAVAATFQAKAWPVLWTGLTTCAAFGSLGLSPVPPVRMLGLWTAFGLAFLTLAALSLYPALIALALRPGAGTASPRRRAAVDLLGRLGRRGAGWATRHRRAVLTGFGAVALLAAAGLPSLTTETNPLETFRPSHPVRAGVEELEARGIGPVAASLVLTRPGTAARSHGGSPAEGGEGFRAPDALRRLEELAASLRTEPGVLGALSAGDVVADVGRHLEPEEGEGDDLAAARARAEEIPQTERILRFFVTPGGERTRLVFHTAMDGHAELGPLYRRAEELARRAFPEAGPGVTGLYPLTLAGQAELLRTMLLSLTLTFGVVAGALLLLLRSGPLTARLVLPNAWPVLLVVGAMGWTGWPVDASTVMVAAVALGLAVDDTLHTLGHLRRTAGPTPAAVVESVAATAPGHVATSVTLALGFAVCAASELVPVSRFGVLAIVALAGALAADLLLVPALLAGAPEGRLAAFRSGRLERV